MLHKAEGKSHCIVISQMVCSVNGQEEYFASTLSKCNGSLMHSKHSA